MAYLIRLYQAAMERAGEWLEFFCREILDDFIERLH